MKVTKVETKVIVNINDTALYYVIVWAGEEKISVRTDKKVYEAMKALLDKKEVKTA